MMYNSLLHDLKTLLIQRKINVNLSTIAFEEMENLNKIINFAITWWLKDLDTSNINSYTKDNNVDFVDFMIKTRPLSKEQIDRLEEFKINMGMSLLKTLLISDKDIELHCGYFSDGILNSILIQSNCSFLDMYLPKKTRMKINRTQIWIKEGYGSKNSLAFDANNPDDYKKLIIGESNLTNEDFPENMTFENMTPEQQKKVSEEMDQILLKITNGELILPTNFSPSKYDFVRMYMASQCTNIELETYKRERKNGRID